MKRLKEEVELRKMVDIPVGSTFIFKHQQSIRFKRLITVFEKAVRADEREECAKVAGNFNISAKSNRIQDYLPKMAERPPTYYPADAYRPYPSCATLRARIEEAEKIMQTITESFAGEQIRSMCQKFLKGE